VARAEENNLLSLGARGSIGCFHQIEHPLWLKSIHRLS
jgi:hypothetical protein